MTAILANDILTLNSYCIFAKDSLTFVFLKQIEQILSKKFLDLILDLLSDKTTAF